MPRELVSVRLPAAVAGALDREATSLGWLPGELADVLLRAAVARAAEVCRVSVQGPLTARRTFRLSPEYDRGTPARWIAQLIHPKRPWRSCCESPGRSNRPTGSPPSGHSASGLIFLLAVLAAVGLVLLWTLSLLGSADDPPQGQS